jgi:hypothetical protein
MLSSLPIDSETHCGRHLRQRDKPSIAHSATLLLTGKLMRKIREVLRPTHELGLSVREVREAIRSCAGSA